MAPTKRAKSLTLLRWLLLLPIPVVWCALDYYGKLTFLENKTIDWRFQWRGELPSPVKLVYVDIDSLSLQKIGNQPWSRSYYARVASALISEAKVKAVAFDIVFSDAGLAESVDRKKLYFGNAEFGRFLMKQPPVVLAASYAGWQFVDSFDGKMKERQLPIVATDPRKIEEMQPPEIPSFETSGDLNKKQPWTPPTAIGLIDTIGNGTRIAPVWAPNNTRSSPYFHMAAQLARIYWGLPLSALRVRNRKLEFVRPDGSVVQTVPLVDGQLIEINWFDKWYSPHTTHMEFVDVFDEAENLSSKNPKALEAAKQFFAQPEFKDAVVLVGPVDPLLQDIAPTSLDEYPVPKVSVHGNLLNTIVSGKFLVRLPRWTNYLVVFGLTLVVTALAAAGGARFLIAKIVALVAVGGTEKRKFTIAEPLIATVVAIAAVGVYVALAFQLFNAGHLVLPFTAPLGAALTTSFAGLIIQVIDEQKAKGRIKGMFGAYVSSQLVDRMVESGDDPQLGGHDDEITAYFSDIQSFSSFSEILGSGPLVDLMNEYLTACTDIVQAEGGTLDKYIGDAVVAMFGAPIPMKDHALRACVASQRVHLKLGELRTKWKSEGDKWPEIVWKMQTRVGLNSGTCMIGNMGSRTRFNYTMMGDNVNLAARMESGAKQWGAYSMCTETTKSLCEKHDADRVVFRPLGRIVVKGRTQAVPIFEIVGLKENVTQQTRDGIGVFEQALAKYYARDWDGALALFAQSRELEFNVPGKTPGVVSNPSLVYLGVTEHYKHEPPADNWDGVYVMKEK